MHPNLEVYLKLYHSVARIQLYWLPLLSKLFDDLLMLLSSLSAQNLFPSKATPLAEEKFILEGAKDGKPSY